MPIVPSAPAPKPEMPEIDPVYVAMAEAEVKQQMPKDKPDGQ